MTEINSHRRAPLTTQPEVTENEKRTPETSRVRHTLLREQGSNLRPID